MPAKTVPAAARSLWRKNLGQGLGLRDQPGWFVVFHDLVSGLEYIRSSSDLFAQGLAIELDAYQTHVFIDFKEMAEDPVGHLGRLAAYLQGRGVASLDKAGREMALLPLHRALRDLCRPELLARQLQVFQGRPGSKKEGELWQELENKIAVLMLQSAFQADDNDGGRKTTETVIEDLLTLRTVFRPGAEDEKIPLAPATVSAGYLRSVFMKKTRTGKLFVLWIYLRGLIAAGTGQAPDWKARSC